MAKKKHAEPRGQKPWLAGIWQHYNQAKPCSWSETLTCGETLEAWNGHLWGLLTGFRRFRRFRRRNRLQAEVRVPAECFGGEAQRAPGALHRAQHHLLREHEVPNRWDPGGEIMWSFFFWGGKPEGNLGVLLGEIDGFPW